MGGRRYGLPPIWLATGIPISVFWLTVQFFLLGIVNVTSFVGLLEFCYSEVFMGMKSIGSSIFYCIQGAVRLVGELANPIGKPSYNPQRWYRRVA
jgi:hypothetical protein